MPRPEALIIDLDDTLFEERDYVMSGFRAVAAFLEQERDLPADYSLPCMQAFFELEGRGKVFDRVIERFDVRNPEGLVQACVEAYRSHRPDIELYDGAAGALAALEQEFPLALVTNGLPEMQQRKVDALEVSPFFRSIIYCDALGAPKPSPKGVQEALNSLGVAAGDALMIGDNPETDGAAAAAAGVGFVRIATPRFAHCVSDAPTLARFSDVPAFLAADI